MKSFEDRTLPRPSRARVSRSRSRADRLRRRDDHDRERQRAGRGFQRSDAARPRRRQSRHDPRTAASQRVHVRGRHLGRDARQQCGDLHPGELRSALTCTASSAVLGSAGTIQIVAVDPPGGGGISPFPGLEANTLYGTALANKRLGFDADPGDTRHERRRHPGPVQQHIGLPGCLTGINWYYGFDGNHGTDIDLVTVLLHEFAHGLNFQQFASVTTGAAARRPDRRLREENPRSHDQQDVGPDDERRARRLRDQLPEGRLQRRERHRGRPRRARLRRAADARQLAGRNRGRLRRGHGQLRTGSDRRRRHGQRRPGSRSGRWRRTHDV